MIRVIHHPEEFRAACSAARFGAGDARHTVGLVPTMGALHAGHLALVREARSKSRVTAVTIFVNPTQFGPSEDLDKYPRTLSEDVDKCGDAGVDLVFAPSVEEMYPAGERTRVQVHEITARLCGASRPTHFGGVATIVAKLFALAGPCTAVFGRKDYQQLQVIRRMSRDLFLPVDVIGHPTVRESDGLAMSSRNVYLSPAERRAALGIPRSLAEAVRRFDAGERRWAAIRDGVLDGLAELRVDYVELAEPDELTELAPGAPMPNRVLLAVAAWSGATRLIDNVVLGEDSAPPV